MPVTWSDEAWHNYLAWPNEDKKTLKRINMLIQDIQRNDHTGIGKPEPLRYDCSCWWSRRIDQNNRLVYRTLEGNIIEIASCKTHYE